MPGAGNVRIASRAGPRATCPLRGMTVCPIAVILGMSFGPGEDSRGVSRSAVV